MEDIKKLREATGAGMVECKKALEESGGDLKIAIEILRKKGIAKAAKRLDREANEGIIKAVVSDDQKKAYILELNSETDFVARNEKFQEFADQLLSLAKEKEVNDKDSLLDLEMDSGRVKDSLDNLSGTIGEKIRINNLKSLSGETVSAYTHLGGKIGVLVALDKAGQVDLARDIAMQIAAVDPQYLKPEEVPEEEREAEKKVYREQLLKEGKPEAILDKIIEGKIEKYYSEVCLVEQEFIKDDQKKVKDILSGTEILGFVRFSL